MLPRIEHFPSHSIMEIMTPDGSPLRLELTHKDVEDLANALCPEVREILIKMSLSRDQDPAAFSTKELARKADKILSAATLQWI
jgi:predicted transcriptional regulator